MKKPFQVGERVRCYSTFPPYAGTVSRTGLDNGAIELRIENGPWADSVRSEWPKACRRLVRRKRRSFWVPAKQLYDSIFQAHTVLPRAWGRPEDEQISEYVEFREVKRET